MSVYTEMVYSQVAAWLESEIDALESEENGVGTFFAVSSRNLTEPDSKKLLIAAKREAKLLRKKANGCPTRMWDWQSHFNG